MRSGFDGPWTTHPLRFDNEYFVNLLNREWKQKQWNGPTQFEDAETGAHSSISCAVPTRLLMSPAPGKLMMLPSDLALIQDPKFRTYVELYAKDSGAFFKDFADAFAKLISLGCPAQCDPFHVPSKVRQLIFSHVNPPGPSVSSHRLYCVTRSNRPGDRPGQARC